MVKRNRPHRYRDYILLLVGRGEGEKTLARLTELLGEPEFPDPNVSTLPMRLVGWVGGLSGPLRFDRQLAFRKTDVPDVELGPGLNLVTRTVNRYHFTRIWPDGKRPRRMSSVGKPPCLRSTWLAYARAKASLTGTFNADDGVTDGSSA